LLGLRVEGGLYGRSGFAIGFEVALYYVSMIGMRIESRRGKWVMMTLGFIKAAAC
jgi:hypothetical protein